MPRIIKARFVINLNRNLERFIVIHFKREIEREADAGRRDG